MAAAEAMGGADGVDPGLAELFGGAGGPSPWAWAPGAAPGYQRGGQGQPAGQEEEEGRPGDPPKGR